MKSVILNLKRLFLISAFFTTITLYFLNKSQPLRSQLLNLKENKGCILNQVVEEFLPSILNISRSVQQQLENTQQNHIQKLISLFSVPSIQNFLPHLITDPLSLEPSLKITTKSAPSPIVIGIGTVRRNGAHYLEETLESIFSNTNNEEISEILVIVMIADIDNQYVKNISDGIQNQFSAQIQSGVLEVIAPPASFYPSFTTLMPSLGDDIRKVKWRAKQVLDYAFLMMYAHQRSSAYYLQLEDDVLVKDYQFVTTMQNVARNFSSSNPNWFLIKFSELGFIGKFFKATDLPIMVMYFVMFYKNNPVDLLLYDIVHAKACSSGISSQNCAKEKLKIEYHHTPPLFHHVGAKSSFSGKVHKIET